MIRTCDYCRSVLQPGVLAYRRPSGALVICARCRRNKHGWYEGVDPGMLEDEGEPLPKPKDRGALNITDRERAASNAHLGNDPDWIAQQSNFERHLAAQRKKRKETAS